MSYSQNLKNEKLPKRRQLLPPGWREFEFVAVEATQSKKGDDMFKFTVRDTDTKYEEDIYALAVEGKAGFLKNILVACAVQEKKGGEFNWDDKDVVDKHVLGLVEHEPNEYINRKGETIKGIQHRIVEFKELAWDDK